MNKCDFGRRVMLLFYNCLYFWDLPEDFLVWLDFFYFLGLFFVFLSFEEILNETVFLTSNPTYNTQNCHVTGSYKTTS